MSKEHEDSTSLEIEVTPELIKTRLIETAAGMLVTHRLVEFGEVDKDLKSTVLSIRNRLMRILPDDEARLKATNLADANWLLLINEGKVIEEEE